MQESSREIGRTPDPGSAVAAHAHTRAATRAAKPAQELPERERWALPAAGGAMQGVRLEQTQVVTALALCPGRPPPFNSFFAPLARSASRGQTAGPSDRETFAT